MIEELAVDANPGVLHRARARPRADAPPSSYSVGQLARLEDASELRSRGAARPRRRRPASSPAASPSRSSVPSRPRGRATSSSIPQEATDQLTEVVLPFAGVEQIRHDRGVEIERSPPRRSRSGSSAVHQLLGPVRDQRRPVRHRAARSAQPTTFGVGEEIGRHVRRRRRRLRSAETARARSDAGPRRANRPRARTRSWPRRCASSTSTTARRVRSDPVDLDVEASRPRRRRPASVSPIASSSRGYSVRNSSCMKSSRTASRSQPPMCSSSSAHVDRRRPLRSTDIVAVVEDLVAATRRGSRAASAEGRRGARRCLRGVVRVDELGRGLLADAGHAGQVVARVAA